ncbi:phosphoribosyltransferase family protein [Leptolyngbya sp. 7M]|uniref:ComF family protein n=1 Tax=Leptolyngbya sp. 7M TaxID=2812896 RepID=UPI001B8BB07D
MPVPLSRERRFERGFNQAEVIAKVVARTLNISMDAKSLTRTAHTLAHRAGMDSKARANTVEKAFRVVREGFVKEKRVLLVDDVLTTGSTVSACARELRRSGAGSVTVFTIARA